MTTTKTKTKIKAPLRSKLARQKGYMLLAVMLLITLMLVALSIELPRISQQIKREKEEELVHRGRDYCTATASPSPTPTPTPGGFGGPSPSPPPSSGSNQTSGQMGTLTTQNIGTGLGPNAQGGGPIIGVASKSKKTSIKEFNGNSEYDQWLFVYDPRLEQVPGSNGIIVASPTAATPAGGPPNTRIPNPSGTPAPSGTPTPNPQIPQ